MLGGGHKQYFGGHRPRNALQWHQACCFLSGHNPDLGGHGPEMPPPPWRRACCNNECCIFFICYVSFYLATCIFLTSFIFIFANKKCVTDLMKLPELGSKTSTEIKIHRRTSLQIKRQTFMLPSSTGKALATNCSFTLNSISLRNLKININNRHAITLINIKQL